VKRLPINKRRSLLFRLGLVILALVVYLASGGGFVYTLVGLGVIVLLFLLGPRVFVWEGNDAEGTKGHS
jgi:hypothetical protein